MNHNAVIISYNNNNNTFTYLYQISPYVYMFSMPVCCLLYNVCPASHKLYYKPVNNLSINTIGYHHCLHYCYELIKLVQVHNHESKFKIEF